MTNKISSEDLSHFLHSCSHTVLFSQYNPNSIFKGLLNIHNDQVNIKNIAAFFDAKKVVEPAHDQQAISKLFHRLRAKHGLVFNVKSLKEDLAFYMQVIFYLEKYSASSEAIELSSLELYQQVKDCLTKYFPKEIEEIILTGSSSIKKETSISDIDIVVIIKDDLDSNFISSEIKKLKDSSLGLLDLIVITKSNFQNLNPTYKYSHLLNLLEFNAYGQSPKFHYKFDEALYFLADFKTRVNYLVKKRNEIPQRKLKKNVYFTNVLQSNDFKNSMRTLSYETFADNSPLGKLLVGENFLFTEKFATLFKDTLIEIYPKTLEYLDDFPYRSFDLNLVDPFFLSNFNNNSKDWKTAYKKSIDQILFNKA